MLIRNRALVIGSIVGCITVLGCEAAPIPFSAPEVEAFEAALAETHTTQGAAGTMMAAADGAGHRWTGVTGFADITEARPVTEETLFRSASIAKTFTGALILSLHEEGLLSVDDPLSQYVDLVPGGDDITLRMLLQHTSGIANYAAVPAYREAVTADPSLVFTYEELVAIAVERGPDFPPGVAWNYSNTGYILLGMVAESVVGRPMHEELRARFFEPLGMRDTRPTGSRPAAELWTGYRNDGGELVEVDIEHTYAPDGGYTTSLDDMMLWARAFFGGRLHRPETLELGRMTAGREVLTSVAQSFGFESGGYGLGVIVAEDAALGRLDAGAGNADGVRTFLGYLPEQDLAFVVAVNVGVGSVPLVETISATLPMLDALRALDTNANETSTGDRQRAPTNDSSHATASRRPSNVWSAVAAIRLTVTAAKRAAGRAPTSAMAGTRGASRVSMRACIDTCARWKERISETSKQSATGGGPMPSIRSVRRTCSSSAGTSPAYVTRSTRGLTHRMSH